MSEIRNCETCKYLTTDSCYSIVGFCCGFDKWEPSEEKDWYELYKQSENDWQLLMDAVDPEGEIETTAEVVELIRFMSASYDEVNRLHFGIAELIDLCDLHTGQALKNLMDGGE